jgi:hypothetical protein
LFSPFSLIANCDERSVTKDAMIQAKTITCFACGNFCTDATSTVRKGSKVKSVQLASFTSRDRAIEFAKTVGGNVGEPTYPDVASSSPDP